MGTCFSSDLIEQQTKPDESQPSLDSSDKQTTPNNVVVFSKDVQDLIQNPFYSNLDSFTYDEMRMATKLFRRTEILGEGGFGVVYKGLIDESVRSGYTKTEVAVKRLKMEGNQGDREWLTEVNYLGHLQHPSLVKLVGYCCEGDHRLLVYEYMAGGSLEKHLFNEACDTLTWSRRMKIALDVAKGLAFLHNAQRPVIYRDFKTANILLDAEFNAKLSDFGLAKDGPTAGKTHVVTRVMGTYGYAAPEYCATGHLTASCDIYGFGVVLLEMLTGLRAVDKSRPRSDQYLVDWAGPLIVYKKKLVHLIDSRMEGQYSIKTVIKVANLAHRCFDYNAKNRPLMSQVVENLESVQTHEVDQEGESFQSASKVVTLFEASGPRKEVNQVTNDGENEASKGDPKKEVNQEINDGESEAFSGDAKKVVNQVTNDGESKTSIGEFKNEVNQVTNNGDSVVPKEH